MFTNPTQSEVDDDVLLQDVGLAAPSKSKRVDNAYAWVVLSDTPVSDSSSSLGYRGPPGAMWKPRITEIVSNGRPFSLLNKKGVSVYEGYIMGEFDGEEPLRDFGAKYGCTEIRLD